MNTTPEKPSETYYDFDEDLDKIAEALYTDSETVRAAVRHLEKSEYIITGYTSSGVALNFYLDHKGLHWKEFYHREIRDYFAEKWIDFFAMLFALGALVISFITVWPL